MNAGRRSSTLALLGAALAIARGASADQATKGFLEPIVHWTVQQGDTCEHIAEVVYGSRKQTAMLLRYNQISCGGAPLPAGTTLTLPAKATTLADAQIRSAFDVRSRPSGGAWGPANPGQPLYKKHNVNTLDDGRAGIEFVDRTKVFMAPSTLVVIYGTAARTQVSKSLPVVKLEEGEIKTGIAAMRGGARANVEVKGGGSVSAASKDTTIRKVAQRTTVSVFHGTARVKSAGKTVEVPKGQGTHFEVNKPPAPPRPLPPAPKWRAGGTGPIVIAEGGEGLITASWDAVGGAVKYRVEMARGEDASDLVVRKEVGADVTSFRAEKMPPGKYTLTVRALDRDDYLGIASEKRGFVVIKAEVVGGAGKVSAGEIEVNPYAKLEILDQPDIEVAIDDGPFGAAPREIDIERQSPRVLHLRSRLAPQSEDVRLRYTEVQARPELRFDPGKREITARVRLTGTEGVDVAQRIAPALRVTRRGGPSVIPLAIAPGGFFEARVPAGDAEDSLRADVVDKRGTVLGTGELIVPARSLPQQKAPDLGLTAPLVQLSAATNVPWWSPTTPTAGSLSVAGGKIGSDSAFIGALRASGGFGAFGVDAMVVMGADTRTGAPSAVDRSAWLGARWRAYALPGSAIELGPALRVGLPVQGSGPPARLEPSFAVGGARGKLRWVGNITGRVRLGAAGADRTPVPAGQTSLLAGGTYEFLPWLRASALLDGHLLFSYPVDGKAKSVLPVGAVGLGVEAGTWIFGGLSGRFGPWNQAGDAFTGLLTIGLRAR